MKPSDFTILLVSPQETRRQGLSRHLAGQGFAVEPLDHAADVPEHADALQPHLLVLDIDLDGLAVCQGLRRRGSALTIFMLAAVDGEIDRVVGLEMGADEYLPRDISPRELLARASSVYRRTLLATVPEPARERAVRIGEWSFSVASRSLFRGREMRVLSQIEFALLRELTSHPQVAIGRERLAAITHGRPDDVHPRTIDAAIMRLRRLVEPRPEHPRYIQTVRGQGYVFVPAHAYV